MPDLLDPANPGRGNREITASALPPATSNGHVAVTPAPGIEHAVLRIPTSAPPLLLFDRVTKWYGHVIGVNQVSLELRSGITGLVGSNGAGKSTLLRLATGQLRPSIGAVTVRGRDAWLAAAKRHVGYSPDVDAFYEDMSGRQFVLAMARLCGFTAREAARRTDECLDVVGMAGRADRALRGYSKGMRQRVKLAQALVHDPDLLILDEPLGGIDPIGRLEMIELFRDLAREGKCLLVSSHELEELEKLTDHVAVMARGRIAAVGTLPQIRDLLHNHPLAIRIDSDDPRRLARELLGFPEVAGVEFRHEGGCIVHARQPRTFFQHLAQLVIEEDFDIRHLETLDESAQAILGYLLGSSR
jgi:ABC-2 type transport system ATP-binding protein